MAVRASYKENSIYASCVNEWIFTRPFTSVGTFEEQVESSLLNIKDAVRAAGAEPSEYVKCDIILKDIAKKEYVLDVYKRIVCEELPAMRVIEENNLIEDCLFSIELIAIKSRSGVHVERFYMNGENVPCAVKAGEYIFTSMMYPEKNGTIAEEGASAIARLLAAAKLAGADSSCFVKNFVHLTDCSNFADFNKVYAETFMAVEQPPARSLHGVANLDAGAGVAVEGIAYLGNIKKTVTLGKQEGRLPFCQAMRAGSFYFISGQVGLADPQGGYNTELVPQIKCMFGIINAIAESGGVGHDAYLKVTAFARQIKAIDDFMAEYNKIFEDVPGVLSFYEVTGLAHPAILVEMDVIAFVD